MRDELLPIGKYQKTQDDFDTYIEKTEYINASRLKLLKRSPLHYAETPPTDPTPALIFGSKYHSFILEPDKFHSEYRIFDTKKRPDTSKTMAANENKAWKYELESQYKLIDIGEYEVLQAMKKRLMSDFYIRSLLKKGKSEVSIYCENYQETQAKVRIDYLKDNAIVDLKTAIDASEDGFTKAAANFDYQIQAALYSDIVAGMVNDRIRFVFIVQEKHPPYATNIFNASPQFISIGQYEVDTLIHQLKKCQEENKWRGYSIFADNKFGVNELELPVWAIKELTFKDK